MLLEFCETTLKDWLVALREVSTDALENMSTFALHIARGVEHLHRRTPAVSSGNH